MGLGAGMENFVPRWFGKGDDDMAEDIPHVPPVAELPAFSAEDEKQHVIEQSAALWAEARHNQQKAQIELAEAAMREQLLLEKIRFQDKEIADQAVELEQERNTNASLRAELGEKNSILSRLLQVLTAIDTKLPVKKPRNGNGNKQKPIEGD